MSATRNVVTGLVTTTLLVSCNAILGVGDSYHLGVTASGGSPDAESPSSGGSIGAGGVGAGGVGTGGLGAGGLGAGGSVIGSGGAVSAGGAVGEGGSSAGGNAGDGSVGECVPASTECEGPAGGVMLARTCDGNGMWGQGVACPNGCAAGHCLLPGCSDGAKNGDETDTDCGGSCGACPTGKHCGKAADCVSGVCTSTTCVLSPTPTFDDLVLVGVGGNPISVALADLDKDNHLDVLVATSSPSTGVVLLMSGGGGLVNSASVINNFPPVFVATGEMTGDDNTDVVVAYNANQNNVAILASDGTGSLLSPSPATVPVTPSVLALADFDHNQKTDVVVVSQQSGDVDVLRNTGNGLSPSVSFTVGASPYSVTVGDFSGDTYVDIATANYDSDNVSVIRNGLNGSLTGPTNYPAGDTPRCVVAADGNGDGKVDLFVANEAAGTVSFLANTGTGFAGPVPFTVGGQPRALAVGNLNGDGKPDLVAADYPNNAVRVLLNTGNGNFTVLPKIAITPGMGPVALAIGDVIGDQKPDIVIALKNSNNVGVLANTTP